MDEMRPTTGQFPVCRMFHPQLGGSNPIDWPICVCVPVGWVEAANQLLSLSLMMMMMTTTTTFLFTLERIHTSVLIINLRMFAGIKHIYIYITNNVHDICYCLCKHIHPLCPHKTWVSADPCWAAGAKAPSNARLSSRLRGGNVRCMACWLSIAMI